MMSLECLRGLFLIRATNTGAVSETPDALNGKSTLLVFATSGSDYGSNSNFLHNIYNLSLFGKLTDSVNLVLVKTDSFRGTQYKYHHKQWFIIQEPDNVNGLINHFGVMCQPTILAFDKEGNPKKELFREGFSIIMKRIAGLFDEAEWKNAAADLSQMFNE